MSHIELRRLAIVLFLCSSAALLGACATTVECGNGVVADESEGESCCGGQVISGSTACCDGVPVSSDSGLAPSCDEITVCAGEVYPATFECCGIGDDAVAYEFATEQCCEFETGAVVQPLDAACDADAYCGTVALAEGQSCCETATGPQVYGVDAAICCDGQVVDVAAGCEAGTVCGGLLLAEGELCCGDEESGVAFEPSELTCCDGELVDIGQECQVVVNECGGEEWPDGEECCGDDEVGTLYDAATEQCCNEATGLVVGSDAQCPSANECGGEVLGVDESCCGDAVNGTPYDAEAQRCCSLATQRLVDATESCDRLCGGFALDEALECCGSAEFGLGYDPETQQCCDAETASVEDLGASCPTIEECGGVGLIEGQECCGNALAGTAYTPSVEQCCDASSADVRPESASCENVDFGTWAFATPCGGDIYFADLFNGIYRADGETLAVSLFAEGGFVTASFCDGDALVWSDLDAGVMRKPLAGGATEPLFGTPATQAFELVAVGNRILFSQNATTTSISVYDRDTDEVINIANNQYYVQHLASDGTFAYWIDRSGFSPVARRMALDATGTVETILTDLNSSDRIYELVAVDGKLFMVSQDSGRILTTSLGGSASVTVVSNLELRPYSIAADETYVYWRDESNGNIRRAPIAGGAVTTFLEVEGGGLRGDVVVMGDYVYAVDTQTHRVYRAAR